MARVVVLGAGISGHTAALHLRRLLAKQHEVLVVSPNADYNWIPSNIWVGVGRMNVGQVTFPLAPVYRKKRIDFRQAKAVALWPEGDGATRRGAVEIEYTLPGRGGERERVDYDYLINATGPKLNFAATPGLGPDGGYSLSVCTARTRSTRLRSSRRSSPRLEHGEHQRLVIGVGHGTCTCEGAAFEYAFNVEHELRSRGLRDLRRGHLPDQRVRARRLRGRRDDVRAERLPHHEPVVDRVAVQGARGHRDPRRTRPARRAGQGVLRDTVRARRACSSSTSPCCCRPSAART